MKKPDFKKRLDLLPSLEGMECSRDLLRKELEQYYSLARLEGSLRTVAGLAYGS